MLRSFLVGAAGYPMLEIAVRRRTHYSMVFAGGLSVMLMEGLSHLPGKTLPKAVAAGLGVTAIEYACGRIWNRHYQVWDYRQMPLNFQGQICFPYTLVWCILGGITIKVMNRLKK